MGARARLAELAYDIGWHVGIGQDPEAVAARRGISRDNLIDLRIRFHRDYDAGILRGRELLGAGAPARKDGEGRTPFRPLPSPAPGVSDGPADRCASHMVPRDGLVARCRRATAGPFLLPGKQ